MSEWMDIKSAPRDGTEFLGWSEVCGDGLGVEIHFWDKQIGWATFGRLYRDPTHWQPLPTPPT